MKARSVSWSRAAERPGGAEGAEASRQPIRTAIVDDSAYFVESVKLLLEELGGFEVVGVAETGAEAVRRVGRIKPDLVLMDVRMPGMDGLEATARIKARECAPVIIMLTLDDSAETRAAATAAGADDFVAKREEMDHALRVAIRRAFPRVRIGLGQARGGRRTGDRAAEANKTARGGTALESSPEGL